MLFAHLKSTSVEAYSNDTSTWLLYLLRFLAIWSAFLSHDCGVFLWGSHTRLGDH